MKTTINGTINAQNERTVKLQKRIGSTLYEVSVRFSATSKETMQDKIFRLIESEVKSA